MERLGILIGVGGRVVWSWGESGLELSGAHARFEPNWVVMGRRQDLGSCTDYRRARLCCTSGVCEVFEVNLKLVPTGDRL